MKTFLVLMRSKGHTFELRIKGRTADVARSKAAWQCDLGAEVLRVEEVAP